MSSLRKQGPITTDLSDFGQSVRVGYMTMYHLYILASRRHGTLYVGVTNSLQKRIAEHRAGVGSLFVRKYGIHRLVHVDRMIR